MLVLDTCVFIWLGLRPDDISPTAAGLIAKDDLTIADVTFLELGYLVRKKRLVLPCELVEFSNLVLDAHAITVTALDAAIVQTALSLPDEINQDPADRIISATAIHLGCRMVTPDANLRQSELVPTVW